VCVCVCFFVWPCVRKLACLFARTRACVYDHSVDMQERAPYPARLCYSVLLDLQLVMQDCVMPMWVGPAQSRCRCGRGGPSPGADVAGVSAVSAQMWRGRAQFQGRCGRGCVKSRSNLKRSLQRSLSQVTAAFSRRSGAVTNVPDHICTGIRPDKLSHLHRG
jgi:hypothetical protein